MNSAPFPSLTPREVVRLLNSQRKLLLGPAIVGGLLAAAYSLVMPRYWEASQALVVRQETAGARGLTPGKFADLYEMRTLQETILELAKSQQVVVATLKAVDQQISGSAKEPTAEEIDKFRERLKMLPPHGGEFGKTEIFYFYMKDPSRERAIALVRELCIHLDEGLKQLRTARAQGLVAELQQQVNLAAELTAEQTQRLASFEKEVGGDLGELRMLHSASSGQSDLRMEVVQLEADLRKFDTQVRETQQLISLLQAAEQDPEQLVATPNSLLTSQPSLRQLKDGLVSAQLTKARIGGNRSSEHPRVKSAIEAESQIRADLHRELATAIRGAEVELQLGQQRVAATQRQLTDLNTRLAGLAERRAEYSNRVAAVDNSRATLDLARKNLSTAKAAEASAQSSSLVTRIDQPETGPYPVGPGRTVVTAAGAVGGLMLGVGLVFLTASTPTATPPLVGTRRGVKDSFADQDIATTIAANGARTQRPGGTRPAEVELASRWDVELKPTAVAMSAVAEPVSTPVVVTLAERPAEFSTAGLAAASKSLLATARPDYSATPAPAVTAAAENKQSLPVPLGALPAATGTLPPLDAAAGIGGISLQEALQAAGQSKS